MIFYKALFGICKIVVYIRLNVWMINCHVPLPCYTQQCQDHQKINKLKKVFMRRVYFIFFLLFIKSITVFTIQAQNNTSLSGSISGIIKDTKTSEAIPFAPIAAISTKDSSVIKGAVSDEKGNFKIESLPFGNYLLKFSILGYQTLKTESFSLNESQQEKNFGIIKLKTSVTSLKTITVAGTQERVQQSGDTIGYNAKAYKTNPDANAEDLISKMPGITSENGTVKAHGEDVKQVLVDGKPFFGDDPNMALKNIPAEIIDKIQIYDKASDQAQFTGFDDGQSNKTINIVTKNGTNNGQFGKIYAGYGTDERYIVGGNINLFTGDRRISLLGLSNNINQQNFSTQDLLGATGGSTGGQGRGGMGGRPGGGGGHQGGGGPGGSSINNFLVGPQSGISTTQAIGLNYSDKWGQKTKLTGSYFFNQTDNNNISALTRDYITSKDSGLYYNENNESKNNNYNHRFNLKFEYKVDSFNSVTITPKLNLQYNNANSKVAGNNIRTSENSPESQTNNVNTSYNSGYTFSNNILLQHKFEKPGRTISWNIGTEMNNKSGNSSLYSLSKYYFLNDSSITDQNSTQNTKGYTLSSSLVYTEPLDSFSQLMFTYTPSFTNNSADKETNNFNAINDNYSSLDTLLSNEYNSISMLNRGGIGYNLNKKKLMFTTSLNAQYATLNGNQNFPVAFVVNKTFFSILPQAMLNYKFSKGTNLRIIYRASTNTPSITQLQNVIDNSNPLLLISGNPGLIQDFQHRFVIRYGKSNMEKATGLFAFLYGIYTQNYIGNSTLIPTNDTTINDGYILKRGSQLTTPVNLQGYWNGRGFLTYALPVGLIKCNLNFNTSINYSRTPALINGESNLANTYNLSGGTGLSSNISENLDFNLSYNANYSIVNNSIQTQSDNNYFYQTTSLKLNWILMKKVVFNTNLTHTLYTGLSQSFDQSYLLWNTSLAYKFFKDRSLEIKISVFDMLGQNTSINRTVTETYIEDNKTNVLNRYYMLTLTYNLKKFKI